MSKSQRYLRFGHFVDPFFLINSFGGFISKFYMPLSKFISFICCASDRPVDGSLVGIAEELKYNHDFSLV